MNKDNELEINLLMTFHFDNRSDRLFLAFLYPFTYQEHLDAVQNWENSFLTDNCIYFRKEVLVKSIESRNVYLLTITENNQGGFGGREPKSSISTKCCFQRRKRDQSSNFVIEAVGLE